MALLAEPGVTQPADVRRYPRSRRNPQFNGESLARELPHLGVAYVWLGEDLGGFRPGGYEAWMSSQAFARGLAQVEERAAEATTAIMCAETVWFRCHRRFIARELVARGHRVTHIVGVGKRGYEEPLPVDTRGSSLPVAQPTGLPEPPEFAA